MWARSAAGRDTRAGAVANRGRRRATRSCANDARSVARARDARDRTVELLPGFPPDWLGQSLAVHDAPVARRSCCRSRCAGTARGPRCCGTRPPASSCARPRSIPRGRRAAARARRCSPSRPRRCSRWDRAAERPTGRAGRRARSSSRDRASRRERRPRRLRRRRAVRPRRPDAAARTRAARLPRRRDRRVDPRDWCRRTRKAALAELRRVPRAAADGERWSRSRRSPRAPGSTPTFAAAGLARGGLPRPASVRAALRRGRRRRCSSCSATVATFVGDERGAPARAHARRGGRAGRRGRDRAAALERRGAARRRRPVRRRRPHLRRRR